MMKDRFELAKQFKNGQRVKISHDISTTEERHSVDEDGNMLAMRGKLFKIDNVGDDRIYINNFMWAPEDILNAEDPVPLPLKKTNILFDPELL